MGDTDYVPEAIKSAGCQVVFHRIPIRPGRPMLGAVGPRGQLVLGLPGNPLSVAVTFRRFGWELLRSVAGLTQPEHPPVLQLDCDDTKTLDLIWFRLVCLKPDGRLSLVPSHGSGDIASLIQSDGFVEIPVNAPSAGCRPFYAW
jgi:molybdopterin molybdotransferase